MPGRTKEAAVEAICQCVGFFLRRREIEREGAPWMEAISDKLIFSVMEKNPGGCFKNPLVKSLGQKPAGFSREWVPLYKAF